MPHHILVVDNDPLQCRSLQITLSNVPGYHVSTALGGQEAIDLLLSDQGDDIDLMVLDLSMPRVGGMDVLRTIRPERPELPVLIHTAHGDVEKAVEALKHGANDFIEKQDGPERVQQAIRKALHMHRLEDEVSRLQRKAEGHTLFDDIIGESKAMEQTRALAHKASKSNVPVLITGESGVGKELFARAVHGHSTRKESPFIAVNCGAIPENLVESVLFGHEKGSFTGAVSKHIGKFREADGGTLLLDEVGELKPDVQVKLLRVLQESRVDPVGATESIPVNVRIVSATNRDLTEEVKEGRFREDLFYRLNVFHFDVPPLRERVEDIPALIDYFGQKIALAERMTYHGVASSSLELLQCYPWPGNVRQLENTVYRALVLAGDRHLTTKDFPHIAKLANTGNDNSPASSAQESTLLSILNPGGHIKQLSDMEEEMIRYALNHYQWRISEVARRLNIGRSTLYRKIAEYNIKAPSDVDPSFLQEQAS